jgi:rSAM/selenodomain-associated transferase 2
VSVSVIIPTLNEENCLAETLEDLRRQQPHEILVVDGGSSDATVARAASADRVFQGPRGRALQMNLGASQARGDVLLFFHADCSLEEGALAAAEQCLDQRGVVAGCFHMQVRSGDLVYRLIDACATARVRWTGLIYGDQGLFVKKELFQRVGGYPCVGLMEDVFLSKILRRQGRVAMAARRIFVSPRRWQRQGVIRQTFRNWTLTALAAGGVHPDRLAGLYPVVR